MKYYLLYSSFTTKGIRPNNQDSFLEETFKLSNDSELKVIAVADGMGGMAAGDVASKMAIDKLREIIISKNLINSDLEEFIKDLFRIINKSILEAVDRNPEFEGMGTTLTVAFIFSNTEIYIANVGDSRAYLVYEDEIIQITMDHDVVTDSKLKGLPISDSKNNPYANALTRSMGATDYSTVDIFGPYALNYNESLLLSSDGFHRFVTENQILNVYRDTKDFSTIADSLGSIASQNNSDDNITVLSVSCCSNKANENPKIIKSKLGLSLLPLTLIFLYVSYLFYMEFNSAFGIEIFSSNTLHYDTLLVTRQTNNDSLLIKDQCKILNLSFPIVPDVNIIIDISKQTIMVQSNKLVLANIYSVISQQFIETPKLLNDSTTTLNSEYTLVEIIQKDSTGLKIPRSYIQTILESGLDSSDSLKLVIVPDDIDILIDSPLILAIPTKHYNELKEIVIVNKSIPTIFNYGKNI